jgi:hypothetical protein
MSCGRQLGERHTIKRRESDILSWLTNCWLEEWSGLCLGPAVSSGPPTGTDAAKSTKKQKKQIENKFERTKTSKKRKKMCWLDEQQSSTAKLSRVAYSLVWMSTNELKRERTTGAETWCVFAVTTTQSGDGLVACRRISSSRVTERKKERTKSISIAFLCSLQLSVCRSI